MKGKGGSRCRMRQTYNLQFFGPVFRKREAAKEQAFVSNMSKENGVVLRKENGHIIKAFHVPRKSGSQHFQCKFSSRIIIELKEVLKSLTYK